MSIKLEFTLSADQDFLFTPTYSSAYTYLIDTHTHFIYIRNDLDCLLQVNSKNDLEKIVKMKEEHCYLVNEDSHNLAALSLFKLKTNHSCPATKDEDVVISYDIKIYQDTSSELIDQIMSKYSNL